MKINEIKVRSILSKSYLADYCINPFVGCQHACIYCYASYYTKKYTSHREKWGEFVDVKINAPEILLKQVVRKKKGSVYLSSLTDPYQPLEAKYKITRKLLEILLRYNWPVCIQTKSSLILRDLDLLKKFEDVEVGFTIITLEEEVRKKFEPKASSVEKRIKALKILKENNISTFTFVGPILPYISDKENNLEELILKVKSFSDRIFIDKLNLKPGLWEILKNFLEENYPELLPKWKEILLKNSDYYARIKKELKAKFKDINFIFCY